MDANPFVTINLYMKSGAHYFAVMWKDDVTAVVTAFEDVNPLYKTKHTLKSVSGDTVTVDLRDVECVLTSSTDDYTDYEEYTEVYDD